MKKFIYIFTILSVVLFGACSDFLTEENKSNPDADTFYKTTSGYESLINACYSTLRNMYSENTVEIFEAGTDLFKVGRAGMISQGLGNYTNLTPADNTVKNFYTTAYQSIKICNDALYYGQTYNHSAARIAEVRFLRAYYYFQLVQQFGDVALVKDRITTPETNFPRTAASEVYTFIIDEMKAALAALPATAANRVNQRVVNHYLSLVYLTRGYESYAATSDFQDAVTYATAAINGQALSLPFDGKTGIFFPGNEKNAEVLFSVQYSSTSLESVTKGNCQASFYGAYLGGSDGATGDGMPYMNTRMKPTMRLYNILAEDPADKRFAGTFMQELYGVVSTGKCSYYSYFKKFDTRADQEVLMYYPRPGSTQTDVDAWKALNAAKRATTTIKWAYTTAANNWEKNDLDKDFPCIKKFSDPDAPFNTTGSRRDLFLARLAETYLIRAEAYVKIGGKTTEAKNDINVVRARAGATAVTESSATIDYILDERARELVGEYKRWNDLKRTGKLTTLVPAWNPDVPSDANMKGNDGNYKILRPIPQDAIGLNSATIVQNPGY
jgi:hypothetical protein